MYCQLRTGQLTAPITSAGANLPRFWSRTVHGNSALFSNIQHRPLAAGMRRPVENLIRFSRSGRAYTEDVVCRRIVCCLDRLWPPLIASRLSVYQLLNIVERTNERISPNGLLLCSHTIDSSPLGARPPAPLSRCTCVLHLYENNRLSLARSLLGLVRTWQQQTNESGGGRAARRCCHRLHNSQVSCRYRS